MDTIFERDGESWMPTERSIGPWSPDALHGGAVAALMARSIELVEGVNRMAVTRMTCDFLRSVPRAPLQVEARAVRPGKKVDVLEADVRAAGEVVARASALRIRHAELPLPVDDEVETLPPGPDTVAPADISVLRGLGAASDIREVRGHFLEPGPATLWFRLRTSLVAGETPTPLQRLMAAADFGNGISHVVDFRGWIFINPDLTVYLQREPVGEWFCLESVTHVSHEGHTFDESRLYDQRGPVGRALQGLLLEKR